LFITTLAEYNSAQQHHYVKFAPLSTAAMLSFVATAALYNAAWANCTGAGAGYLDQR
jgi:hypothetical protein